MKTVEHLIANDDGWHLSLHQTWDEARLDRDKRPVLIVPGYGMNSFIFSYHPRGTSLEGYLANAGHEVWRVDLRAQGGSISVGGGEDYGIEDLANDLGFALRAAIERTRTKASRADAIGCSLGGTIMLLHAALDKSNRFGSMVAVGTPVRWVRIHPMLRALFGWPGLVGAVRFRGTRGLVESVFPHLARHVPWLLSLYLNPALTDTDAAHEMVKTVEDPNRHVNREIAKWVRAKDLVVRGVNLTHALADIDNPLLCVLANGDGIVPRETAEHVYDSVRSASKRLIEVGTATISMAHADMFISNEAHARVFAPIAEWLGQQRPMD